MRRLVLTLALLLRAAALLRVPLGPALDPAALNRALDAAKRVPDGSILFRPQFRERVGADDAAVDAVYDAMTSCRGPTCDASRLARWKTDPQLFAADVGKARLYELAVLVVFNFVQTSAYYVIFISGFAREILHRELLPSRGPVDFTDAAVGLGVAVAAAVSTTNSLRS